jgi:uncharacterized protein (DUF1697 family)
MKTYISMLRGINVSGQKKIKMEGLKELYESLGFENVQTYIQSGNVIFECPDRNATELKNRIEGSIIAAFGYPVAVLIRTTSEFQRLIENNPLLGEKNRDATKLHVTFLSDIPEECLIENIKESKAESEDFSIAGREIYLYCPEGYGRTRMSNNFFEKKLKVAATTRNWKTVNKLLELAK